MSLLLRGGFRKVGVVCKGDVPVASTCSPALGGDTLSGRRLGRYARWLES